MGTSGEGRASVWPGFRHPQLVSDCLVLRPGSSPDSRVPLTHTRQAVGEDSRGWIPATQRAWIEFLVPGFNLVTARPLQASGQGAQPMGDVWLALSASQIITFLEEGLFYFYKNTGRVCLRSWLPLSGRTAS